MSIHKDDRTGKYYVKYKNKTYRGYVTKHEAQQCEAKLRLQNDQTKIVNIKLYDLIRDYLKVYKSTVTYGTYHKVDAIFNLIIIPNTANKAVGSITELDCRSFREAIEKTDYSTRYKNEILNVYKAVFKHAEKYYKLKENPTYVIDSFKKTQAEKLKKKEKETSIWSPEEFQRFISKCNRSIYKELFMILYFTGMRIGEAQALTWSDFYNGSLHITKNLTKKSEHEAYEIKEPKTVSSVRSITLGSVINQFLEDFKKQEMKLAGFNENWYIFGRLKPLPYTSIERIKNQVIKEAGVKSITLHGFRHSHASNLIANGMNIVAVSRRLGHSDINITLQIYTHLVKKNEDEVTEYLGNLLPIFSNK